MDRLIVKNFGPLKDVDIELNKINIFIGENGSGKSVLAKLVTIVLNTFMNAFEEELILKKFIDFNINYIDVDTLILYVQDGQTLFTLENRKFKIQLKENTLKTSTPSDDFLENFINEIAMVHDTSQYIPAERNLISLFNKYVTTFITADIPLPKFLLNFSSEYTRAKEAYKELDFLNVKYVNSGEDKIYYTDKYSLKLEHSSSGIQSALPLYLTVKYFAQKHRSIIIEEPEQNLFPKAQKETVEYIVEQIGEENQLFMMTHSPYILTALNNLILANDVKEQKGVEALEGLIKEEQCIPFEKISAYSIIDGKSIDIMDKENRLIGVNVIDDISDEVSDTFDTLLAKLD